MKNAKGDKIQVHNRISDQGIDLAINESNNYVSTYTQMGKWAKDRKNGTFFDCVLVSDQPSETFTRI